MQAGCIRVALLGLLCSGLVTAGVAAQGKKGPRPPAPEPITGTAVIRCASEFDLLNPADVICADGQGAYVDGEPGVTVWLGDNGALLLRVSADAALDRAHVVRIPDFHTWDYPDCNPKCVANIPDGGLVVYTGPRNGENAYVSAGYNLDGGLAGMVDGETDVPIKMSIGFPDPNPASSIRWSLYWDPEYYAGTDWATASRSGCTWTIRADDTALAGFWLFRVNQGKVKNTQEGRFKAPVEITFTADSSLPGC